MFQKPVEPVTWEEINAEVERRFACEHASTEVRVKVASNTVRHYWKQCLRCGRSLGAVPKATVWDKDVPPFDQELERSWWRRRSEYQKELSSRNRLLKDAQWFEEHDTYLNSVAWLNRRAKVLARDRYRCQAALRGCTGEATQVHHLTYTHWQNEPLFDLQSVCDSCHRTITAMDRQRRNAA